MSWPTVTRTLELSVVLPSRLRRPPGPGLRGADDVCVVAHSREADGICWRRRWSSGTSSAATSSHQSAALRDRPVSAGSSRSTGSSELLRLAQYKRYPVSRNAKSRSASEYQSPPLESPASDLRLTDRSSSRSTAPLDVRRSIAIPSGIEGSTGRVARHERAELAAPPGRAWPSDVRRPL